MDKLLRIIYNKKMQIFNECIETMKDNINSSYIGKYCFCDVILDEILDEYYDALNEENLKKEV